jgi:CMP-N-acetylneuraminic acid synthetase
MKILITICARGGSKGIPGKNIKLIGGKPLIAYTIGLAKLVEEKFEAKIALSTDDIKIKNIAEKFDITTEYIRPKILATDTAGKIETIRNLLEYEESIIEDKYDYILDLDITSPLRTLYDIEKSFKTILEKPESDTLFSVNIAARNPYFNMVEENKSGFFSLVKNDIKDGVLTRQSAPKVYDLNASFYWYRRGFFENNLNSPITQNSLIYEMPHICFDLDHPIDFLFLDFLLTNKKLDFQI